MLGIHTPFFPFPPPPHWRCFLAFTGLHGIQMELSNTSDLSLSRDMLYIVICCYPLQRNEFQSPHLKVKKGEYECPLCRQLGNSVIPCIPSYEESSRALVLAQRSHEDIVKELTTRIVSQQRSGVSCF